MKLLTRLFIHYIKKSMSLAQFSHTIVLNAVLSRSSAYNLAIDVHKYNASDHASIVSLFTYIYTASPRSSPVQRD